MKTIRTTALAASALAAIITAAPASAATIVLNGIDAITNAGARHGFQTAANYWAATLTDNVTLNFNVAYASLGAGILGSTGSSSDVYTVSSIYGALAFDASSVLDASAVATLDPLNANGGLTMITPGYTNTQKRGVDTLHPIVDSDGGTGTNANNNRYLDVNTANAKALGDESFTGADASITFSSNFAFDFDPSDGISAGTYDFIGVAVHEMGHALGFVSGVDTYDYYGQPNCGTHCLNTTNFNQYAIGQTMDLFRYSAAGDLNWNPGSEAYFSVTNGATELYGNANFSTGDYNGDGYQASHWKANDTCSGFIGIMNPYLCSATLGNVTAQDVGALDAIGWDLADGVRDNAGYSMNTAQIYAAFDVPEPAVWMQLILGFGVIGSAYRSARRRQATFAAA